MVDDAPGINVCQRHQRQASVFLLLIDPGGEGLLDDPTGRPLQPFGEPVDLLASGSGTFAVSTLVSMRDPPDSPT